eukprot:494294_1
MGDCDTTGCSDDVMYALSGGGDMVCSMDYSCLADCFFIEDYIDAQCTCDTGFIFTSFSFDFIGNPVYCCGDDSCQDAVATMYTDNFSVSYGVIDTFLTANCADITCSYSMSYMMSMSHSFSMGGCASACPDSISSLEGDQDAVCALDDLSCLEPCGLDWINANCACDTDALFASYSYDFAGNPDYCCGDDTCQDAVV